MSVIYVVLPLALLLAAAAVAAFTWAVRRGQFDDVETPAMRILYDDEPEPCRRQAEGSSAWAPGGQERQEVDHVDGAVPVEVGWMAGVGSPAAQEREEIDDVHDAAAVDVGGAGRGDVHREVALVEAPERVGEPHRRSEIARLQRNARKRPR